MNLEWGVSEKFWKTLTKTACPIISGENARNENFQGERR